MILVLTTYRTGSTNFCKDLAEQHKYENLDECFHENLPDLHKSVLRHLHKNKNCVVKLMPYHIEKSPINNLLDELLPLAEKVYVLIRKGFDLQCQSYYVCRETADWHNTFYEPKDIILDREKWQWCVNFLHNQYFELESIYRKIDNQLIYTHQFDQGKKYVRPVRWDKKPGFVNIDIEELFD